MRMPKWTPIIALVFLFHFFLIAGERPFSFTPAPAKGDYVAVNIGAYSLGKYLSECQINRPEVLNDIKQSIEKGRYYRKSTKDQKGKPTTVTAHVNPDYMLRIVTWRDEACERCGGTGKRKAPFATITGNIEANFRCTYCNGKGFHENQTTERYFVLSPEDFENPEEGRRIMATRAYSDAPQGAQVWVERLASRNPQERLDACLWLDKNYVRVGMEFLQIEPMLRKARYHDADQRKRIMVWQFWAGKDISTESKRAFYRIYADTKTGKVTRKGFYPER